MASKGEKTRIAIGYEVKLKKGFKAAKRKQMRNVMAEFDKLWNACAYTPAMGKLLAARQLLEEAKDLLSVKKWGK